MIARANGHPGPLVRRHNTPLWFTLRRQVPLADRLLMRAAMPVAGLAARLLGPQILMNRYLGLEALPTAEQERLARCRRNLTTC